MVEEVRWRKSTKSGTGNCVEVKMMGKRGVIVRNSRAKSGGSLWFTESEWEAFVEGVKEGEFDNDSG